jgi:hypothetical protein
VSAYGGRGMWGGTSPPGVTRPGRKRAREEEEASSPLREKK